AFPTYLLSQSGGRRLPPLRTVIQIDSLDGLTMDGRGGRDDGNSEPVKVIVRVRPELKDAPGPVVVAKDHRTVALLPPPFPPPNPTGKARAQVETKVFAFDRVARPLVISAVNGYNSTIFAYGHTGSGKTHTMMGTKEEPGVTTRAVEDMFAVIRETA
ncbi:unnamed protein product, partial [Discosporangium mesarthrocarpum]